MSGRSILHVTTFAFPDKKGGAERIVTELASAQARAGDRVTLVASGAPVASRGDHGVRRVAFALDSDLRGAAFLRAARRGCRAALAALSSESFDVVHVHQPATASVGLAHPAGARVATFHAAWSRERSFGRTPRSGPARWVERLRDAAARKLDEGATRGTDRLIVHSRAAAEELAAIDPGASARTRRVDPGVDCARFCPLDVRSRAAARAEFGHSDRDAVVIALRRLVPRTGVDLLLRAFASVAAEHADVRLVVAGDGPERVALERLAAALGLAARVLFAGALTEGEVPRRLAAADLCVMPSRALEGFGLVTLEALACGTPVLATAVGANPEVLARFSVDRRIVEVTADGLSRGMREFLREAETWRAEARCAAAAIGARETPWSWDACAARVARVYDEALAGALRPRRAWRGN